MKIIKIGLLCILISTFLMAAIPLNRVEINQEESLLPSSIEKKLPPCFPNCNIKYKQGEPRMEKISYFYYLDTYQNGWGYTYKFDGYFIVGCYKWYYRIETYKLPVGCNFRYQY